MKGYNEFTNVSELLEYYNITLPKQNLIVEDKKEIEDENAEDKKMAIKANKMDVVYADQDKTPINIFKHIILFTNNKDPKGNKTLKNIYDALEILKKEKCEIIPELHIFEACDTMCEENEDEIIITDGEEEMVIKDETNLDVLVFSRLGVQDEDMCEHCVQVLQDRGFLVLNPIKQSALACDKYESALLFQKGEIPQPKFSLMTKDILYDEELYHTSMSNVYPEWDKEDSDKNKDLKFVVKILDGHGGTGVAMIDGKSIYAILQLIFAIDGHQRLLLQRKEEADGGDIRVHVLTLRNKQVILAAMKRVKLGNDFRSNVSLGAEAEKVTLTEEQEQIALKTAKLSKLPWCAVDIMPLVKGSNKEIGDNVVLEINASPGTDGISGVIERNFINILLNELKDPTEFVLQDKVAGFIESVEIEFGEGIKKEYLAKLDTGNSTKASTIEVGEFELSDKMVKFMIDGKEFEYELVGESNARAGEETYKRPIIILPEIKLGLRKMKNVPFALVKSREKKTTNVLLNRDVMSKMGYVIHPYHTHVLTKEMEKVKII